MNDWLFSARKRARTCGASTSYARLLARRPRAPLSSRAADLSVARYSKILGRAGPIPAGQQLPGISSPSWRNRNAGFDASKTLTGLVIDEWQELIPNERKPGIAFNYDAPNAEPPNALLLAVCERPTVTNGNSYWGELAACVEQSLLLARGARSRPGQLRHTELDTVLPRHAGRRAPAPVT